MSERDKIVDWLDKQIQAKMVYEQMPDNDNGYEYVPREEVVKIVDAIIPMIKGMYKKLPPESKSDKKQNNPSDKPD